ncbi:MAG: hypothetical protein SFU86_16720, partial [Pirellulaceae bacterium]|nr:hypothetical protein [Pirellulaceae bacterium]
MHDESRLLLCRAGFGLFCVAPTLLVALWCMQRASGDFANAQRDEWQLGLSHRLGLAFEIESVSYPSLGSARLAEVRALDPETKALLFQVPLVEVIPTAAGWKIVASRPQIEAERLPELVATLNDRLLRGSAAADQQCELIARDATLLAGPASRSFAEVAARLEALPTGPMLTISAGPMQLIATRNRQQTPPATRWQFDTAGQSLPMALLQAAWPKLAWLGAKAQFAGRLDVVAAENGLAGEMGGELAGVDLDSLVS